MEPKEVKIEVQVESPQVKTSQEDRSISNMERSNSSNSRDCPPNRNRGRAREQTTHLRGGHCMESSPSSIPNIIPSSGSDSRTRGRKKRRKHRQGRRSNPTDCLQAQYMQGVITMTKYQKKAYKWEAKKKLMPSRLSMQQTQLFMLVSAQDWDNYHPHIKVLTEGLLEDRDLEKAWNLV